MLNASVGVQRVLGRVRRPSGQEAANVEPRQARRFAADNLRRGLHSAAAASRLLPVRDQPPAQVVVVASVPAAASRRSLIGRLGHERAVAFAVAGILIGASVISISAGQTGGPTGGTTGAGQASRIAVGGGTGGTAGISDGTAGITDGTAGITHDTTGATEDTVELNGVLGAADSSDSSDNVPDPNGGATAESGSVQFGQPEATTIPQSALAPIEFGEAEIASVEPIAVEGPFIEDGTLVKPIAVDTVVPDGSALVMTYTVKAGDKLAGIAGKFRVSTMTIMWANNLKSKDDIHKGQVLRIPPVTGLIVKVAATDTLDAIAARYSVGGTDILATNGLDDPNLVVGQVLVIPGAKGAAILEPKLAKRTTSLSPRSTSGSNSINIRPPAAYSGAKFLWPVVGGGNYISQYFHYGHYALDIAADYGSTVRAAAAGTVIFAGWKSNGGGYQVWVAHGSGLYTTYNHMSSIAVGAGQHVDRGEQVGRIGQSGNATGPHLHFEVWRGAVWDGGQRVNPLGYL